MFLMDWLCHGAYGYHHERTTAAQTSNMIDELAFTSSPKVVPPPPSQSYWWLSEEERQRKQSKTHVRPSAVPADSRNPSATKEDDNSSSSCDDAHFFDAVQTSGSTSSHSRRRQREIIPRGGAMMAAPPPPSELPLRYLRAGKGDASKGWERYQQSLAWRAENQVDTTLQRPPHPQFRLIKRHYWHYVHLRGRKNEPCFYEKPSETNLKALKSAGVGVLELLDHYVTVVEYLWQVVERDDFARSLYILDLQGIRLTDFVGDVMDFVKKASAICNLHYPERAGVVFLVNVPRWFNMIWRVVKPWVDESTLDKIKIHRGNAASTSKLLQEFIPLENIPPEYGGTSMPLGQSPEDLGLMNWLEHNLQLDQEGCHGGRSCGGVHGGCPICTWTPARSY